MQTQEEISAYHRVYTRSWREKHPEEVKAGQKIWRAKNKEKISADKRKWRKDNVPVAHKFFVSPDIQYVAQRLESEIRIAEYRRGTSS